MFTFRYGAVLAIAFVVIGCLPQYSTAATYTFTPQTERERQAYLYGQLQQLTALRAVLEQALAVQRSGGVPSLGPVRSSLLSIDTKYAYGVTDQIARLTGEAILLGNEPASVWFEYGEVKNFLDLKTSRISVRSALDRAVSANIKNLEEDQLYYFRMVAIDDNDEVLYGPIRSFTTKEEGFDEFTLLVDDTSVTEGDEVKVSWRIPDSERNSRNWIGLFQVGAADNDYEEREFIGSGSSGSERFDLDRDGSYEFRLFLDGSYKDVATSRTIRVYPD